MDSLPLETFQLICSYCSLYTLAHLRLVSTSFLNKVDGSLNARRRQLGIVHATNSRSDAAVSKSLTDPRKAGYITMTLGKGRVPMEIAFNGYNPKYNYLEFIQKSPPNIVSVPQTNAVVPPATQNISLSATTSPMVQYAVTALRRQEDLEPSSLGRLVLHSWEQDKLDRDADPLAFYSPAVYSSSESTSSTTRPRRSSIGQAQAQRQAEAKEDQAGGYMGRLTRAFWGATSIGGGSSSSSSSGTTFSSSGNTDGSPATATATTTTDALVQAAQSRFYANDPELSPQDRQYKFDLRPGEHFLGDHDFMIKYTVGKPIDGERLFEVDYIRVAWKWILSGIGPVPGTGRMSPSASATTSTDAPQSSFSFFSAPPAPSPTIKRLGGIYTARIQRVLAEVQKQGVSSVARGELALQGYTEQVLPRSFLSVNLHAEPVVAWIMRMDPDKLSADRDDWEEEDENDDDEKDVLHRAEQDKDQQALEQMVGQMKEQMGFLTCRCVLEELLEAKGLSRSLVWSVGRVRRQLMDPVPPPAVAFEFVRVLEATDQQRAQHRRQHQHQHQHQQRVSTTTTAVGAVQL